MATSVALAMTGAYASEVVARGAATTACFPAYAPMIRPLSVRTARGSAHRFGAVAAQRRASYTAVGYVPAAPSATGYASFSATTLARSAPSLHPWRNPYSTHRARC